VAIAPPSPEPGTRPRPHLSSPADLAGRTTCSVEEAAAFLGIGRSTAYAAARDGSLPTLRLSHRLLVPTAKLLAMVGAESTSGEARCSACSSCEERRDDE
jgi:excisionase family DNA binding protein